MPTPRAPTPLLTVLGGEGLSIVLYACSKDDDRAELGLGG